MAYHCKDCSYRGVKSGQLGECPACGSFNIGRESSAEEKPRPGKLRITLLIGLWAYLIALIIWKLFN